MNVAGGKPVIAAVEPSPRADSVIAHAAWAAGRLRASLRLLHVVEPLAMPAVVMPDPAGIGPDTLMTAALLEVERERSDRLRGEALALFESRGRELLAHDGLDVAVDERPGDLAEVLEGLQEEAALLVLGKRGALHPNDDRGHLGSQLERVLRALHLPVLVAAHDPIAPTHAVLAFDGSEHGRELVARAAADPLLRGLPMVVARAGTGEEAHRSAEAAAAALREAGHDASARVLEEAAATALPALMHARPHGLLVMGAYAHSRLRTLLLGSTTAKVLRACPSPVLVLR